MKIIERGKRISNNPVDDASWHTIAKQYEDDEFIHTPNEHGKYAEFIKYINKHPYKFVEYCTGQKLPLWRRIYIDVIGKFKKTDYEKRWIAINKAIKPYIRKK